MYLASHENAKCSTKICTIHKEGKIGHWWEHNIWSEVVDTVGLTPTSSSRSWGWGSRIKLHVWPSNWLLNCMCNIYLFNLNSSHSEGLDKPGGFVMFCTSWMCEVNVGVVWFISHVLQLLPTKVFTMTLVLQHQIYDEASRNHIEY